MKKLILLLIPLLLLAETADAQNKEDKKHSARLTEMTGDTVQVKTSVKKETKTATLETKGEKAELEVTDTLTNEYLDSLKLSKDIKLNDYTLIGFQYGAGLSQVFWNPAKEQDMRFIPINVGVTWTRYGKMFGYMPYFGIQAGIFYAREGYKLSQDPEKGGQNTVDGYDSAIMDVIEVPVMAHCHLDFWKMKVMLNLGLFGGYRMKIHRNIHPDLAVTNPEDPRYDNYLKLLEHEKTFQPYENRFDFGIKGGIGFAFIFDPIEIHIEAMYKHSLSSLYQPDYASKYYYRYAYPSNIIISAGIHFQLTKRVGKTKAQLKRQAKLDAYGKNENTDRQGR